MYILNSPVGRTLLKSTPNLFDVNYIKCSLLTKSVRFTWNPPYVTRDFTIIYPRKVRTFPTTAEGLRLYCLCCYFEACARLDFRHSLASSFLSEKSRGGFGRGVWAHFPEQWLEMKPSLYLVYICRLNRNGNFIFSSRRSHVKTNPSACDERKP